MPAIDGIDLLDRLTARRDLIACLKREPLSKPELVEACGVSRSTVDRGVAALADAGIVARGERGRYELTLFGEVVTREVERTLDRMESLVAVSDFLGELSSDIGVDADLFDGATINYTSGQGMATIIEAFDGASEVRLVDPPFPLVFIGLALDTGPLVDGEIISLVRRDILVELSAFSPSIVESFLTAGFDLYEIDDHLPFSFALVDRPAGLTLCLVLGNGRDGLALVETEASTAIEWGEALFDRFATDARPVSEIPAQ